MAIKGLFLSNQAIVSDRVGDFAGAILHMHAGGTAPLLAISSGMESEDGGDTVCAWFEENKITGRTQVQSGGVTTTVSVTDASAYVPGMVLYVEETGEVMLITDVVDNDLSVTRGMGGTTITSLAGAEHVVKIGSAYEEASEKPQAVLNQGAVYTNYQQIFRNTWSVSGTAKVVEFHTGSKLAKSKREAAGYHAEDIERAMIWGVKHIGTRNGKPFFMMDGILSQIRQRGGVVQAQMTNTSMADFRDFLRRVFTTNVKGMPNERIAFAGNIALQTLNEAARLDGSHEFSTGETDFGLKFSKFISPFGDITVMTHPLMNESPLWQSEMYVLHPGAIKTKWLRRTFTDDHDKSGSRPNGLDADEGVLTSQVTIKAMAGQVMGIYTGMDTPAAS